MKCEAGYVEIKEGHKLYLRLVDQLAMINQEKGIDFKV